MAYRERFSMSDFGGSMVAFLLSLSSSQHSVLSSPYLSSALSTRPKQFLYSLTNEDNTKTEGPPTPGKDHSFYLINTLMKP